LGTQSFGAKGFSAVKGVSEDFTLAGPPEIQTGGLRAAGHEEI